MKLLQRLETLEQQQPTKPVRMFSGYEDTGLYYEVGQVNYRLGINNAPEPGQAYTKADIAELERQGYEIQLISIVYEDLPIGGNFADHFNRWKHQRIYQHDRRKQPRRFKEWI